ncbi:hypothetical protein ACHAW6_012628 [Cyclotella cf. meneghiniana]
MSTTPTSIKMDRGTNRLLETHLMPAQTLSIRQTRLGWFQECLGCEAKGEFKFFKEGQYPNEFATAIEDSGFCIRCCCAPCHPFKMTVAETGTNAELLSMDRPCACCVGACKCCCYQKMSVTSAGQNIGSIEEQCFCCVPRFVAYGGDGEKLYKIHSPTCCCGMCIDCCAEGNPCGKGCCKVSFRIYPASQAKTDGDAPYLGVILKKPKSLATELFTSANAFDLTFPENASANQKALLVGSAIFFNVNFFERQQG